MENKLGRKSMWYWQEVTEKLTADVYESGFKAGYDAAKDEVLDIDTMAQHLVDRYNDEGLSNLMMIVDKIRPRRVVKSANQQRAELIQRAREFVGEQFSGTGYLTGRKGYQSPSRFEALCDADFIVNQEKHTVVCLLRSQIGEEVTDKGIAKCMPDEVFNEDIGKAIALARALEIDVPKEFMEAIQPNEVVVGMSIRKNYYNSYGTYDRIVESIDPMQVNYSNGGFDMAHKINDSTILDDTNAQY